MAGKGRPEEEELVARDKDLRLPLLVQRPGSPHSQKYTFFIKDYKIRTNTVTAPVNWEGTVLIF